MTIEETTRELPKHKWESCMHNNHMGPEYHSGQIIIHQPRFPWNKGISLTKPPLGVSFCLKLTHLRGCKSDIKNEV